MHEVWVGLCGNLCVEGKAPSEWQEGRPEQQVAECDVPAVFEHRDTPVQANEADQREHLKKSRSPTEGEAHEHAQAGEQPKQRFGGRRQGEEEGNRMRAQRLPQCCVVRQHSRIRIKMSEVG